MTESSDKQTHKRNWNAMGLALIDQGFVSLNNFVTFILVVKFCSRADVNLYVLAWSIFNVFRVIQERGLAAPYFVLCHQPYRDSELFLGSSLFHQRIFSALTSLFFIVLAVIFLFRSTPQGICVSLTIIAFVAPFMLLRDQLRAVSCAHSRFDVAVLLSGSAMILQVAIIVGLAVFVGELAVSFVFVIMGIASLIPCLAWFYWRPQPWKLNRQQTKKDWRDTFEFSKWLVAARFFPTVSMALLPWLIMWSINEDATGIFGACLTIANISNMFVFGANYFFLPRTVKSLQFNGSRSMVKVLLESAAAFTIVLTTLCVVYWLAGDLVLGLAFDQSFVGNATLVTLIGLSFLIVSYSTIAGNGMTALGKPSGLFWGELAYGFVLLLAAARLVWSSGLNGAAIAMCLAALVATIVETLFLVKLLRNDRGPDHEE